MSNTGGGRRSPSRIHQQGSRSSRQHAWLQSSVARRLLAESQFFPRPASEPSSNGNPWLENSIEGPGTMVDGRYLPSSKAKYDTTTLELKRQRTIGGQKFYSNSSSGYDDSTYPYNNQQVPIIAWNAPQGASNLTTKGHSGYTLPDNITIVTLEEIENSGDVLLRLAHLYEEGEHSELSKPAYIDVRHLFDGCQITSVCEMDLSATQFKGNVPDLVIQLRPMQVRTFLLTLS